MPCDNAPLTVQQFVDNIVSPKFPAALSLLNLLEAHFFFGEYLIFFLPPFAKIMQSFILMQNT